MGTLYYGSTLIPILIDDRTLIHLKTVTTSKLRRRESFFLSWSEPLSNGGGRVSIWICPTTELIFVASNDPVDVEADLLERMSRSGMSRVGIVIEAEFARPLA